MKMVDVRIYTYSRLGQHYESMKHPNNTDKYDVCIGSHSVTIPVPRARSEQEVEDLNRAFKHFELQRKIDKLLAERDELENESDTD